LPKEHRLKTYRWAARGDVNAFFGLMLDNLANLVLVVGLLQNAFAFPANFAVTHLIPGTALGVLLGDLLYFLLAWRLAAKTGRNDVTAMPLGLDTPSVFAMALFVLGPAFVEGQQSLNLDVEAAARRAWFLGIGCLFTTGLFKLACAGLSGWIRRALPRAGLLGSLAAVALVLISFFPLLKIFQEPVAGLLGLAIILTTLVARVRFPGHIPGALASLVAAGSLYYLVRATGLSPGAESAGSALQVSLGWHTPWAGWDWLALYGQSLNYLPVILPFALANVVGGIDCAESASAAGDDYETWQVIAVEAVSTLIAAVCGGVIQTTPFIGHPAYKAMGARSGYVVATALFIGGAGLFGYFGLLFQIIPPVAILPILIFIGLEITAQSYAATPSRHYAAIAVGCLPAVAYLITIYTGQLEMRLAGPLNDPELAASLQTLHVLAGGGGFIVASLLWSSALAALIDRRLPRAAVFFAIAAGCCLCGIIHSPLPGGQVFLPWTLPAEILTSHAGQTPYHLAAGYAMVSLVLAAWGTFGLAPETGLVPETGLPSEPSGDHDKVSLGPEEKSLHDEPLPRDSH